MYILVLLKFTPLEFETHQLARLLQTPLDVKIYSVGVLM